MRNALALPSIITLIAKLFSFVINPNFCQLFIFIYFRQNRDIESFLFALFFLAVLPLIGYVVYVRYFLKRENLFVLERKRRFIPFMVNIVSIILFHFTLYALDYAESQTLLIMQFLWFLNITALIITFLWRISIHQIATSASVALIMQLETDLKISIVNMFLIVIIILVGWSRFHLKGHTIPQIIAGSILGFISIFGFKIIMLQLSLWN